MKPKFYIHRLRDLYAGRRWRRAESRSSRHDLRAICPRGVCEPHTGGRLLAAWEVFRGRAYAFEWPKVGDIEEIIERVP